MKSIAAGVLFACAAFAQQARLEGTVVDSSSHTLERVKLTLVREGTTARALFGGSYRGPITQSGAEGTFSFDSIEPGRYLLLGEKAGFVRQEYGDRPAANRGDLPMDGAVLDLGAGLEMKGVVFRMTPTATITGRVLDENGDPVRNAVVKTSVVGREQEVGFARTDPSGAYRIGEHPPGEYDLYVSYVPRPAISHTGTNQEFAPTYYPHTTERAQAKAIRIDPGATLAGYDLTAGKKTVVRVSVRGRVTGTSVPKQIRLTNTDSADNLGSTAQTEIASDGSFEFAGIEAGRHMILAGNGGSASVNGWAAIETSTQDLENVEIVTRLEFELPGRVVMDNGEAPAGLRVIAQIDLNDGWSRNVTTDAKGGFVVKNLVNGKYRLRVDVLPPGVYQAGSAELDLTGGAPSEPLVITLKRSTGEVTGTVSDLAGARAIVTLVPESGRTELLRRVTTDQNGRYVMKDVAPGAYRIYAWNELEPSAEFPKEGTSVVVRDDSHQTIKLRPVR